MIVDTGVLYAALDRDDAAHERSAACLTTREPRVVPEPVIAETAWLVRVRLGVLQQAAFIARIDKAGAMIEAVRAEDRMRAARLIATYKDLDLGYVDASIVAIAERLGEARIATLDHRHFSVVRPRHLEAFELVPH